MELNLDNSFTSFAEASKVIAAIMKGIREQIHENHLRKALHNQSANQVLQLSQDMLNITLQQITPIQIIEEDLEPEKKSADNFIPYQVRLVQPVLQESSIDTQAAQLSFFDRSSKRSLRSWRKAVLASKLIVVQPKTKPPSKTASKESKRIEVQEPKYKFVRLPTPEKVSDINEQKYEQLREQKKNNIIQYQRQLEEQKKFIEQKQKQLQEQRELFKLLNSNKVTFDYNGALIHQKPALVANLYNEIQVKDSYDEANNNNYIESLPIPKQKFYELKTVTYYKNVNNIYNNNGERQLSMIPKLKVSEGVKLLAYDEYGTQEVINNQNVDKSIKTLTYSSYMDLCQQRQFDLVNFLEAYHSNVPTSLNLSDNSKLSLISSEKQSISSEQKSTLNPTPIAKVPILSTSQNNSIISNDPVSLPKIDRNNRLSIPKKRDRSYRKYSCHDSSYLLEQTRKQSRVQQYNPQVSENRRNLSFEYI